MTMRLLLLLVPLVVFTPCTSNETALRSALSAIWKAVLLLKKEYKEFNLDGMVGYKILLEQIKGTLERCDTNKDPYTCILIERLKNILKDILNKTSYFTKQRDPEYFEEFQELLGDQFWTLPTSWKQTAPGLVYRQSLPDISLCFTEEFSDECMSSLLGNLNENKDPCVVTAPCLKKMTQKGCTGYSLSHQLLFFIVGKMKRCRNDPFVKDIGYYTNVFCANMMKSNLDIEHSGYPLHQQDLFMENIMLCGLCGYSDFYKVEWMNKIISWQDPIIGCFGDTVWNTCPAMLEYCKKSIQPVKHMSIGHSYLALLWPKEGQRLNSENVDNENHSPKRVKRRERMFLDVCLSHKTAVAVGTLGGFLYSFTFM